MKKIIFLFTLLLLINLCPKVLAQNPSEEIVEKGWFSSEEYNPNKTVTRADAIKLLMRMAINLPDPTSNVHNFADTIHHPDKQFINKARYYGVIRGGKLNRFDPTQPITKAELVVWMDYIFSLPDTVDFNNHLAKDIQKTGDGETFYAINKYLAHEIVTVDGNGNFHPNAPIKMSELAIIAERMDGVGIKNLKPVQYEGQKQKQKILEPR